jgi:hypothetical protein
VHPAVVRLGGGLSGLVCFRWTHLARRLTAGHTGRWTAGVNRTKSERGDHDDGDEKSGTGDPPADRRSLLLKLLIVGVAARGGAERLLS